MTVVKVYLCLYRFNLFCISFTILHIVLHIKISPLNDNIFLRNKSYKKLTYAKKIT